MDKKTKTYIGLLLFIILSLVYIETNKPKKINWFPSYSAKHKIPYGTYILRNEIPTLFDKIKVIDIYKSPYLFLKDSTINGNYFFVDNNLNFGKEEFNELLKFVEKGNNVFISTNGANIDTLNAKTKNYNSTEFEEVYYHQIKNRNLNNEEYYFDRDFDKLYFSKIDTANTTVLGELIVKNNKDSIISSLPNFIKTKHDKGSFYLHTFPEAFTNYNILLENNHQYVSSALSYLNNDTINQKIYWDCYYKKGKSKITSPMYYILNSKYLKWAYYVALIGVLFFILFKGKRKQRVIPVITPLQNQSLAFTRTISNMYYEKSEHKNIADHKINYFFEHIRLSYRLSTLKIDNDFYKNLASRSNNSFDRVKSLFNKIEKIKNKKNISSEELLSLNKVIEEFKKASYGKKK